MTSVYYELVDPDTKQPIPMENGAKGEALFTTLDAGPGGPMIRQSMGDIHQVFTDPCPCGRSGFSRKWQEEQMICLKSRE